jgi:hypothetical protein
MARWGVPDFVSFARTDGSAALPEVYACPPTRY